MRLVNIHMRNLSSTAFRKTGALSEPDHAINELNIRLREHSLGCQFENGHIVRMDSELIHTEIVKPTLLFLSDPRFAGPEEEYLKAHAHYRTGEYEDAIVNANRAFESTMRTICDLMNLPAPSGSTAGLLVNCIRDLGLLPDYLDKSFDQLAAVLKSGLPKVRDNAGGHGQAHLEQLGVGFLSSGIENIGFFGLKLEIC